jgi:hypothetical protein
MLPGGLRLEKYVPDAGVLALYFAGRRDAEKYIDMVYEGRAKALMCKANVAGFPYNYARVFGWDAALARHALMRNSSDKHCGRR